MPKNPTSSPLPAKAPEEDDSSRRIADLATALGTGVPPSFERPFEVNDLLELPIKWPDGRVNGHVVKFTPEVVTSILNSIARCGVISQALQAHGLSATGWLRFKSTRPQIEDLVKKAMAVYADRIESAIHTRAIEGWLEPVYFMGTVVGFKRKFSDSLLELHAKRHIKEYRDKSSLDVQVSGGALVVPAPAMDADAWLEDAQSRKRVTNTAATPDAPTTPTTT